MPIKPTTGKPLAAFAHGVLVMVEESKAQIVQVRLADLAGLARAYIDNVPFTITKPTPDCLLCATGFPISVRGNHYGTQSLGMIPPKRCLKLAPLQPRLRYVCPECRDMLCSWDCDGDGPDVLDLAAYSLRFLAALDAHPGPRPSIKLASRKAARLRGARRHDIGN